MIKKKPLRIIYETTFHGKGLAIGVDPFNWTVLHFTEGQDPQESRKRWHFTSLPKMLRAVHRYFVKERIKRLDFQDLARVAEGSYEEVEKLGEALATKILRQAPYGALPRFPCDHILGVIKKLNPPLKHLRYRKQGI